MRFTAAQIAIILDATIEGDANASVDGFGKIEEAKEGAKILKGKTKYDSLHCGGIVIFEEEGKVPEELVLKNDSFICQIKYDKDETEDAGFIKIDILSNRGLAQWSDCRTKESLDSYLPKDNRIKELFSSGNTIGLTFGESRGMRNIFMIMKKVWKNIKDVKKQL